MLFGAEPGRVKAADPARPGPRRRRARPAASSSSRTGVATFTCSTRTETDQRVHVYGTEGRISIEIPFNIPPDRPTRIFVTAGGDPPVAPATETLTFDTADPYACEADRFADAVLDGVPLPVEPEDAVANLRVIEALFADGRLTARRRPVRRRRSSGRAVPSRRMSSQPTPPVVTP